MRIVINKIDSFNVDISTMEEEDYLLERIEVQYTMFKGGGRFTGNFNLSQTAKLQVQNIVALEIEAHLKQLVSKL